MKKTIIVGSLTALGIFMLSGAVALADENNAVQVNADIRAHADVRMAPQDSERADRPEQPEQADQNSPERGDGPAPRGIEDGSTTASSSESAAVRAPKAEDRRTQIMKEIEFRKQEREQRIASSTEESKAARVDNILNMVSERFTAELGRFSEIESKIVSRLDKFDAAGATTTTARIDLATASSTLSAAEAKISAIGSIDVSTSTIQTAVETLRQAVKDAQMSLIDAQKSFMKVVADMKGIQASLEVNATTTENDR